MDGFIKLSNFPRILPYAELFKQGIIVTILLSLLTVVIGFLLGNVLAMMRLSDFRPLRFLSIGRDGKLRKGGLLLTISKFNPISFLATVYVEIIRSTPVIVQIFIIYFGKLTTILQSYLR